MSRLRPLLVLACLAAWGCPGPATPPGTTSPTPSPSQPPRPATVALQDCGDCGQPLASTAPLMTCGICVRKRHLSCYQPMEDVVCDACEDQASWAIDCVQLKLDRLEGEPRALLSPDLLDFWLVMLFQGVVDNGGFQFLFERNLPPDITYARVATALRRIGAEESAGCLERAVAQFPFEDPEADPERRIAFMRSQRPDPEERKGAIDLLGDRVIELSPFTYHQLANYLRAKGLAPPD